MKVEYSFSSADGVSQIHCVAWEPEGEPVAALQLVHGMVEYIERYQEFAEFLNTKGFVVFGHDHIGHGDSVSSPEELGVMHARHPSDIMVEDICSHYTLGLERYPGVPRFILGHSMGSYMLRKTLCEKAQELSGLAGAIIMGTGTEANLTIRGGLALINVMSVFKGETFRSKLVQSLTYGPAYKQFDCYGNDPSRSWLSKNVENVTNYYKNPKCTFIFTLAAYRGLLESTLYDNKAENIANMKKDLPIFFVSGQDDPVGNMGKGVIAARDKFKAAGLTDLQLKLYEGDRHEILNELDREQVYEDLLQWMVGKCS